MARWGRAALDVVIPRDGWMARGVRRLGSLAQWLLVLVALASVITWAADLAGLVRESRGPDEVTAYEARLAELRRALPRHGTVGYLSDADDVKFRYLTQYVLAPLVVDPGATPPLVVGNFSREEAATRFLGRGDYTALGRFGHGVVLLGPR